MKDSEGRKPLSFGRPRAEPGRKLVTVTLRLLPAEIAEIKARAAAEGIGEGEWKRRAIRAALGRAAELCA